MNIQSGKFVAAISMVWIAGSAVAQQSLPLSAELPIVQRGQHTTQWCWAASAQMVMESLGKHVRQCDQANAEFGRADCCQTPTRAACIDGGWPQFQRFNFTALTTSNAALSWDQLRTEIALGRVPFTFSWHYIGGGGHMLVAKGFKTIDGVKYVTIVDPMPVDIGDTRDITYDSYVTSYGGHWNDFYHVRTIAAIDQPMAPAPAPAPATQVQPPTAVSNGLSFKDAIGRSASFARKLLSVAPELAVESIVGEKQKAKLDVPFANVFVRRDQLAASAAPGGKPPTDLLTDKTNQVLYSARVNGVIKKAWLLEKQNDHWKDTGIANKEIVRQLIEVREQLATAQRQPLSHYHAVSIPALNAYFVAYPEDGDTKLVSIATDPRLGTVKGQQKSAKELMPKLAAEAAREVKSDVPR